ncbi:hypothetical protein GOP47_0018043 [Adiantum capillus-veneris]|uniref:Uncharacterized protein n=1 Tax=Adiantum capillus-veneris TaxID=13818 RepID=A0A9D4UGS8_ADICA|nr:hypothetical protein GOP47_0018043 [Adiantum capillus-veneris]
MQESLTFPLLGSPSRFTFPELTTPTTHHESCCSELSSSTSTPFVSAPSSPSRMMQKGFYFSAPASPTWPKISPPQQQAHVQQMMMDYSSCQSITSWSHDYRVSPEPPLQAHGYGESAGISSSCVLKSCQYAELHESLPWTPHTEAHDSQHHGSCSSPCCRGPVQSEHYGSSNVPLFPLQTHHKSSSSWSPESLPSKLEEGPRRAQQAAEPSLQTGHRSWDQKAAAPAQVKHSSSSHQYQVFGSMNQSYVAYDAAVSCATLRRVVKDLDQSYSRNSLYASAVPFAWEEKPGTPKARSVASETSNGEDDAASILLSGSSEFEFSARFTEHEEPPMSPTPISTSSNSFKHHFDGYDSPSSAYTLALANDHVQSGTATKEQIWPLRPPPRLDNPVLPMKQLIKDNANQNKHSHRYSLSSLSAPQSPRSPRKFDIRGVLCGIASPDNAVFDPFLVAMEKSMEKDRGSFASESRKSGKKETYRDAPPHRRTQSSSPLRIFHWDDHSAKSNSSSNGSSSTEDIKSKHPIQREIDARHNAGTPKGSKRWSFRGFLHRKSDSGGESARHSNTSLSLRSSGRESNMSSTSRRESCSSPGIGEGQAMDMMSNSGDDMNNMKMKSASSHMSNNSSTTVSSMPSTPPSMLSSSASNNSSKGKLNTHHKANQKGPYALHYNMQRAHTEELRKKTFLPYKHGLLGCLGFPSKSYRAIATLSKPLQSVS